MTEAGTAEQEGGSRTPRWLLGALIASLALNLLVIGAIGGAMWRHHPRRHITTITPNLLGYATTLGWERHRELWDVIADARQELRPLRREVRLAREEIMEALVADPFDPQKLAAAQAHLGDAEVRARPALHKLYATLAAHLTVQERRGFKRWRERLRPPGSNLLDEPEQQAKEPHQR
jgi:uncharacterized membrane protein